MKRLTLFFAILLASTSSVLGHEKFARVDGNTLILDQDGASTTLHPSSGFLSLPLWSRDGRRLAVIGDGGEDAIANLFVIDFQSGKTQRLVFRPHSDAPIVGMRFVESLEWVGDDRLALAGSTNPSQVETVILDPGSGRELDSIFSDSHGVSFSIDGQQFAYLDGMPHFAPKSSWKPVLKLNHRPLKTYSASEADGLSAPAFSIDGHRLAIGVTERHGLALQFFDKGRPGASISTGLSGPVVLRPTMAGIIIDQTGDRPGQRADQDRWEEDDRQAARRRTGIW